jgi:hypothetical protein
MGTFLCLWVNTGDTKEWKYLYEINAVWIVNMNPLRGLEPDKHKVPLWSNCCEEYEKLYKLHLHTALCHPRDWQKPMQREKKRQRSHCGFLVVHITNRFNCRLQHWPKKDCYHYLKIIEIWHWPVSSIQMFINIISSRGSFHLQKDLPWEVIFLHNQVI